jgi:immunity protein, SdpI family
MCSVRSPHLLVAGAGYALGALALYSGLPQEIPPSWSVPGRGAVWLGAPMVAFLLPTAVAVTDALLRGLSVRHPVDETSAVNVLAIYDAIMLRFMVFVVGVHATVLAGLLGMLRGQEWAAQIVPLMLGFTMISIGNLLPRTRPNLAIGIRTRLTLSDRALWIRLHRSAGHMVVACGAVLVLSAMTVPRPVGPAMILLVGPAALVGTCLLVRFSRKHVHA